MPAMTPSCLKRTSFVLTIACMHIACNALLGVDDVRLKPPANDGGDSLSDAGEAPEAPLGADAAGPPATGQKQLKVSLGESHSCATKSDGSVRCWGDNSQGQAGVEPSPSTTTISTPRALTDLVDAVDVAAGRNHTCVARTEGKVMCWGYNLDGQLGNGESDNRRASPVEVSGLTRAFGVAAGGNFSCAVRTGRSVACWGGNSRGQLGTGNLSPSTTPVAVVGLRDATSIAAGQAHACATTTNGLVWCWGDGANGQLGTGQLSDSAIPLAVSGVSDAVGVAAGERFSCALTTTGKVMCWGANELGQLGRGSTNAAPNPVPVEVPDLVGATAIHAGRNHMCAVIGGSVKCWGASSRGQLGEGASSTDAGSSAQASPVKVSNLSDAIGVAAGGEHTCATTKTGAVVCWGNNDRSQLGSGSTTNSRTPRNVPGFP
jgi:alpha-tubulin suppressor-like RCC1 family protein